MDKELERFMAIEEELKARFQKASLVLLNSSHSYEREEALHILSLAIFRENEELSLQTYPIVFLIQMQKKLKEEVSYSFLEIYKNQQELSPYHRVYGQLLWQFMYFLKQHPFFIEEENKEIYFHTLLEYHTVSSFMKMNLEFSLLSKTKEYCDAYFRILYSFPGFEFSSPFVLKDFLNPFLGEYATFEKTILHQEFMTLLEYYQLLTEEDFLDVFQNFHSSFYYLLLFQLLLSYFSFEEIEEKIDFVISSGANRIFLKDFAHLYLHNPKLHLVSRKDVSCGKNV